MNRKMATGLVSALLLASTAAFAGTPAHKVKPMTHAKAEKTAMHTSDTHKDETHTTKMHKVAMRQAAMHKVAAHKAMDHKTARPMLHKAVWKAGKTPFNARETKALNALEAAGYRGFKKVHQQGQNIDVQAAKGGKSQNLMVTPAGKILPQA